MSDNRYAEAVDIVARHLNANRGEDPPGVSGIPDEHWGLILQRAQRLAPDPDPEAVAAAVDYLTHHKEGTPQ